ncbi:MAG: flagellar M-ring protein FliF [Acidobacteria bacterium]|nr:flagellar M-ring protein FliF [Acidobacteriota bacterium]
MLAQISAVFRSLTVRQRIAIAVATVLVVTGIVFLNRWNHERGFQPLFTGLSSEDAGVVVAKLKEGGVEYRLSSNGSEILVPAPRIPELRLQMATAGVPKTGRIGFELFDKTNFGITDFAEQVNYRRAIEGETERSILTINGVESARVHITPAKDSVFTDAKQPAKASVVLKLKAGAKLTPPNVDAIAHLLSAAVQGLEPSGVSVVDGSGKLLRGTEQAPASEESEVADRSLAYRQKIEKDLLEKINATLEPLVGAQKYRTGVSVECDFTSGEQSEETFDPEKSVVSNSQKSEEIAAMNSTGGQPGTASNLPRPATRAASAAGPLSRKTENTTYQNSRVVRKTKLPQGSIQRLSIAVVLDHQLRWEVEKGKAKKVLTPISAEQMNSIRDLISGIAGIDAKRGDSVVVQTLPFDLTLAAEPPPGLVPAAPAPSATPAKDVLWMGLTKDKLIAIGGAAGVLLLLASGGGFWFYKRRKRKIAVATAAALGEGEGSKQLQSGSAGDPSGTEPESDEEAALIEARQSKEILGGLRLPVHTSKKAQVLTKHIAQESKSHSDSMAQIVRTWLNEETR